MVLLWGYGLGLLYLKLSNYFMIKVIIIEDEVYVRFMLKSKFEEFCLEI